MVTASSRKVKTATVVGLTAALVTRAAILLHANSIPVLSATQAMKAAARTSANFLRRALSAERQQASAILKKHALVQMPLVQPIRPRRMAPTVATAYNVPVGSARLGTYSAKLSWEAIHRATTHILAILRPAQSRVLVLISA